MQSTNNQIRQKKISTSSVQHLPVSLFGSVMGLAGLSLAWRAMDQYYGIGNSISDVIGVIAATVFIILSLAYLTKLIKYPQSVIAEFSHSTSRNFFGTIIIAMLLLSAVANPYYQTFSENLWTTASLLMLMLSLYVVSHLKSGNHNPEHIIPALIISCVGPLNIPATGALMQMPWAAELNLFALATGAFLAIVFIVMIVSRLIHYEPLSRNMTPSLLILISPFEVGFLAYTSLFNVTDRFAGMLFYAGIFLFIILSIKVFFRKIPFTTAWWAVSFPVAAMSKAALKYAWIQDTAPLWFIACLILLLLNLIVAILTIKTLLSLLTGKLLSAS